MVWFAGLSWRRTEDETDTIESTHAAQQSRLSLFFTKYNGLKLFPLDKERTEHCYANSMVSAIESFFMFPLSLCKALRSMVFTLKFSFDAKKRNGKGKLVQIKIIVRRVRCPFWSSSFHVLPLYVFFFHFRCTWKLLNSFRLELRSVRTTVELFCFEFFVFLGDLEA